MTALAGCWNYGGKPSPGEACERMLAAQRLYGSHSTRWWSGGAISLGRGLFRTLPEDIYDRQPLHAGEGQISLVADLRLDNREELASELQLNAHTTEHMSDAQMLLLCLERWHESALDRLVGDFAFALWDTSRQELLLARDFLGQRPLHYHRGNGFFAFASMPKGLHALAEVPYAPDEQMAAEFITLMPQWGTRSFFQGIETVEPGHIVTVNRDGLKARRYWRPARPSPSSRPNDDYVEGLRHHLDLAVQSRLRGAGDAIATHLSSGFDSAAVTATAARAMASRGGKVAAFTSVPRVGYEGPVPENRLGDEGPLAAQTAALYPNVEHILIAGNRASPLRDLDRYFFLFDRPQVNLCNMVWISAINEAARKRKLTVLLTAEMGNVTISYSGAERLAELLGAGSIWKLLREGRSLVANGAMRWGGVFANSLGASTAIWRLIAAIKGNTLDLRKYSAISLERLLQLDIPGIAKQRNLDFAYRPRKDGFDTRLWVLRRTDPGNFSQGMLGGWGIDQRDPTADRRLVEYCLAVPMDEYLRKGQLRSLGSRALSDRLPRAVLNGRQKGYQAADWHEGLTAGRTKAKEEIARLASFGSARRLFDIERLQRQVDEWPESGWHRQALIQSYRLALLRGISTGHFLRKASGSNQ